MRLKSLKVFGFKTFAETTTLDFVDGTTAVVGPNGSGKSNLVDAIRWVLGEQSTRSLRSQKLEDVIFALGRWGAKSLGEPRSGEIACRQSLRRPLLELPNRRRLIGGMRFRGNWYMRLGDIACSRNVGCCSPEMSRSS